MLILACLSAFDSGSLFACLCVSVRVRACARTYKCPQRCTPVPRCVWCVYIRVSRSLGTYVREPSSCFRVTWQLSLLCHCIIWPVCFYSCAHVSATWLCWFAWITSVFYGLTYTVCTIRVFVYPCTFSSFPEACWLVWFPQLMGNCQTVLDDKWEKPLLHLTPLAFSLLIENWSYLFQPISLHINVQMQIFPCH